MDSKRENTTRMNKSIDECQVEVVMTDCTRQLASHKKYRYHYLVVVDPRVPHTIHFELVLPVLIKMF